MTYRSGVSRKREALSRAMLWSGVTHLMSTLPERDSLSVLNYHRIGNANHDLFDPDLFTVTAEEFNEQIAYLKRHVSLVTLDEALGFLDGSVKDTARRCRVLITLDDGYLDNYDIAFPILRSHGVQGVFFLVTGMVGSCLVPWWDHIAYLVKTTRRRSFALRYPFHLTVDIDRNGLTTTVRDILDLYKRPENCAPERFITELTEEANAEVLPKMPRRFVSWDEAREMAARGMVIGSHTHSHPLLSQLQPDEQLEELSKSRALLKEQLGGHADVLAYPVGARTSFTKITQVAARDAGYRAAFSFYGGTNLPREASPYDLRRIAMSSQSLIRMRVRSIIGKSTGNYWP
jgi:peptidoglycan/xylan/chitin deacetylase (PgdA/CDA1 family)